MNKNIIEAQNEVDIKNANSEFLAASVVVYRSLGVNRDFAVRCMEELILRRKNGDEFEYEEFIEKELKKIPQPSKSDTLKISESFLAKKVKNPLMKK